MRTNNSKLIVVIDDSADSRSLLETLFLAHGWNVYGVANGKEALALLKELTQLPDLIILDVQMPVMNGMEFRIAQSRNERLKHIPVIVMSASSDDGEIRDMRPDGLVSKPLQISNLIQQVAMFL